ncbi:hypothetical protein F4778DRAFT_722759 [Xylariomycetidae sp. FL2044]|nr:hypothetical protein F4778DRAFT_722759 [Xylariomycetidae sp. FL2044]
MANLPQAHPNLSLHLTDRTLTPLITSSSTSSSSSTTTTPSSSSSRAPRSQQQPQLHALTALTHTALNAHESALRLGLGSPQRIIVESRDRAGPVLLQTFLEAGTVRSPPRPPSHIPSSSSAAAAAANVPEPPGAANALRAGRHDGETPGGFPGNTTHNNNNNNGSTSSGPAAGGGGSDAKLPTANRLLTLPGDHGGNSDTDGNGAEEAEAEEDMSPMLIGTVIAPGADEAREARSAATRLERVGREVQRQWAEAERTRRRSGMGQEGEGSRRGRDGGRGRVSE